MTPDKDALIAELVAALKLVTKDKWYRAMLEQHRCAVHNALSTAAKMGYGKE